MTQALAFTRARMPFRLDLLDTTRSALVLFCAGALIAAGPMLPALG